MWFKSWSLLCGSVWRPEVGLASAYQRNNRQGERRRWRCSLWEMWALVVVEFRVGRSIGLSCQRCLTGPPESHADPSLLIDARIRTIQAHPTLLELLFVPVCMPIEAVVVSRHCRPVVSSLVGGVV